jgi:hypothetical protein
MSGFAPVDVGDEIKHRYGKDITSVLHKQIARLSKESKTRGMGGGWKTTQKTPDKPSFICVPPSPDANIV